VKRGLDKDPRYDAVGSSSLREELFNTYLKTISKEESSSSSSLAREVGEVTDEGGETPHKTDDDAASRKERKERAIREREAKVREERGRLEAETARSRGALSREEGELVFRCVRGN
jgi:transcription elongation regulator 1